MFGRQHGPKGEHWEHFKKKYESKPGSALRKKRQGPSLFMRLLYLYIRWKFPEAVSQRMKQPRKRRHRRARQFTPRNAARGQKVSVDNYDDNGNFSMGWNFVRPQKIPGL